MGTTITLKKRMMEALERAVTAATGKSELARQLGISPQAVSQWKIAPIERVLDIERVTGINRFYLRPDFYAVPVPAKAKKNGFTRSGPTVKQGDEPLAPKPKKAQQEPEPENNVTTDEPSNPLEKES